MPRERVCANNLVLPEATVTTGNPRARLRALVEKMSEEQACCAHLMMRMALLNLDTIAEALRPAYLSWEKGFDPVKLGGFFELADYANKLITNDEERRAWVAAICLSAVRGNEKAYRTIENALRLRVAN